MSMSPESKALIAAARRRPATPNLESRDRMRAKVMGAVGLSAGASALGAAGTAGATGAAASTGAAATGAAVTGAAATTSVAATAVGVAKVGLITKLLAVVVIAGTVTGGIVLATGDKTAEPTPTSSVLASPPRAPSSAEIAADIAREALAVSKPEQHRFETPAASQSADTSSASPPTASVLSPSPTAIAARSSAAIAPDEDPLKAETKLLASAQAALSAGDPAGALRITNEHAKLFPKGALAGERRAIRALALCAQGHKEQGRAEAASISKTSPLGERIDAACH